ncbi:hypothetical protein DIPPA_29776 [Diplonema papillatum]|nr:hypothetical protein DIPPA_29776 [Diplonema papillatum]
MPWLVVQRGEVDLGGPSPYLYKAKAGKSEPSNKKRRVTMSQAMQDAESSSEAPTSDSEGGSSVPMSVSSVLGPLFEAVEAASQADDAGSQTEDAG